MAADYKCTLAMIVITAVISMGHVSGFKPCSTSSKLRYDWGMYTSQDGETFTHAYDITILSNALTGFQLTAFPGLSYFCYSKSGSYYAFRSELTTLFNEYNIYVYFCWYFKKVSSSIYNIEEMTEPVMVGADDYAKAYLESDADPGRNDICTSKYSSKVGLTAPYKQIRKIVIPTWGKK